MTSTNKPRFLPQRATRGKRYHELEGSDAEFDQEFWGDGKWEVAEDSEWSMSSQEAAAEEAADDSDYSSSDSDAEAEEEAEDERRGQAADLHISKQERKSKKKEFDYAAATRKRLRRPKRIWSILDPNHPLRSQKVARSSKKGCAGPKYTHEYLLKEAYKIEEENLATLQRHLDQIELQKTVRQDAQDTRPITGEMQSFFSWSSERKIPAEEERKSEGQRAREAAEGPHERQMIFFLNVSKPELSAIPELYRQLPPPMPHTSGKYLDPVTEVAFDTIETFKEVRTQTATSDQTRLCNVVKKLIDALRS